MKVWRGRMRRQLERAFMAMPGRHRAADACLFGAAAGGHYAAYRLSPRSRPGRARGLRRDGDARQRERPLHLPPRSGRPVASGHPHRSDLDVQQMCRRLDLPSGPGRAGGALESEIARLQGENASLKKQMIARGEPLPEGIRPDSPGARPQIERSRYRPDDDVRETETRFTRRDPFPEYAFAIQSLCTPAFITQA
jgi:hypothetical protein